MLVDTRSTRLKQSLARLDARRGVVANTPTRTTSDLGGFVARRGSCVAAANVGSRRLAVRANVGQCSSIAEVLVDSNSRRTANHCDVVNNNVTLVALRAIPARTVQLSEVVCVEVLDLNCSSTVVLDDLVLGMECASTDDI